MNPPRASRGIAPAVFGTFFLLFFSSANHGATSPAPMRATPSIAFPPTPQAAIVGGKSTFTVIAIGDGPLSYQWRKNGLDLTDGPGVEGATADALMLAHTQLDDAGDYSVVVTNSAGSTTSAEVALTVTEPRGGDVDGSFEPGSSIQGSSDKCFDCYTSVDAVAVQPDGKLLLGGSFTTVAGAMRGGIARLHADGTTDPTFQNGMTCADAPVFAMALQPDGRVLIGGGFSTINGVSRTRIARLNADGSLDASFAVALTGEGAGNPVIRALVLQPDGKILIGGSFGAVHGVARNRIARLNADGGLDTGFLQGMSGAAGGIFFTAVNSIVLQPDGRVLIAGGFTAVNGLSRQCVARLNADGSTDASFQNPQVSGQTPVVYAIALQPDGKVPIAGGFRSVGGVMRSTLARLNADGTLDTGFVPAQGASGAFIAAQLGGKVLVSIDAGCKRLNADGSIDPTFQTVGIDVHDVASLPDGRMFLVGSYGSSGQAILLVSADGIVDPSFGHPLWGVNGVVRCMVRQPDGKTVIGGDFTSVNGTSRHGIARLNADGSLDAGFLDGMSGVSQQFFANTGVFALALQPDGKVLIGGAFDRVNGESRDSFARLNMDGSLDMSLLNGMNALTGDVHAIVLQPDGKFLVGGRFMMFGEHYYGGIVRLNSDGNLDTGFLHVRPAHVNSVVLQPDGKILIGGRFETVDGLPRGRIARLNTDGSVDRTFQEGMSGVNIASTTSVESVALQADGKVLIGGSFTEVNGEGRKNIARLHADGSVDGFGLNLGGTTGNGEKLFSLLLQPDGRVLVGGDFAALNGVPRNRLARLNADGNLDASFQEGMTGPEDKVLSMALEPGGRVLVGGSFSGVNGVPSNHVARLFGTVPVSPIPDADGDGLRDDLDNCPIDFNLPQSDLDEDGVGDVCDLDDGLIWEWRVGKSSVRWQAESGPTSWNVYFGDLEVLRTTGVYTQDPGSVPLTERCQLTVRAADDLLVPASGLVSFSLVTGVVNGIEGDLGSSSSGPRANTNPCP